ncbi:hypothetical protein EPO15_06915 [bacterium]|nr:MAG: hypothetical protein EPO15_06915 [bacterium]
MKRPSISGGRMMKRILAAGTASLLVLESLALPVGAKTYLHAPDGTEVEIKEGTPQADLSAYRTPLESKVASRRFVTDDHLYLANEEFLSGTEFYVDAVEAGLPVAHWPEFQWVTAIENYWYSRYTLEWATTRAHAGVSTVHGPYWTLKARELYERNRVLRDRGERVPANKGVVLSHFMPLFYKRTGMPRVFDDAAPTYLNYASADPHFIGPVVTDDDFDDPQSGKKGGWGMPRYYLDYYNTRWNRDSMNRTIDMGGTAQAALKQAMWVQYFWHSDHTRAAKGGSDWDEVKLLGNDAEEGFRGIVLALASFNTLLEAKASLFSDEKGNLGGIDPFEYDPAKGLRYIPHAIGSNLALLGDLPMRPWSFHVQDKTSRLWDQASWLWLSAEYWSLSRRFERAFTHNPPVDGGVVEKETGRVALGLASALLKNIALMHKTGGVLASEWTPGKGASDRVATADAALLTVAAKAALDRFSGEEATERSIRDAARGLITAQADFLLAVQGSDGAFSSDYSLGRRPMGGTDLSAAHFWGIRGLLAAWQATKDDRYLKGAFKAYARLNEKFWDEKSGLYRTRLGDDTVTLTPKEVAAALGALREMTFALKPDAARAHLERFVRHWVQAVDVSGLQMAENYQTGELAYGVNSKDEDGDGILFVGRSHGPHGVAPIAAGKVYVNIGGQGNRAFTALPGDAAVPAGAVRYAYRPDAAPSRALAEAAPASSVAELARTIGVTDLRADGGPTPEDSKRGGEELFRLNCAVCHGARGQGITGKPLAAIARDGGMRAVVVDGRPMQRMPHWSRVLAAGEIGRIVNYVEGLFAQ